MGGIFRVAKNRGRLAGDLEYSISEKPKKGANAPMNDHRITRGIPCNAENSATNTIAVKNVIEQTMGRRKIKTSRKRRAL